MRRILFNIALLCAAMMVSAQEAPEKLPMDPDVRYGQLDNGLTYYIRHNEQPKQRCEFHIAQAVGAILEEDHQNGLAHFLEHMAFNGTQHFPGKGIINYFESVGVNFGGNINAYTSIDETVYRLSDVPTYRSGIIDSALLVMHDWSCGLLLLDEEIDAERGVILEEWRTGRTARRRIWKELNAKMYPGTQYAKRDVIGDTAVINNFAYQALRDYYHKWYGPDNQATWILLKRRSKHYGRTYRVVKTTASAQSTPLTIMTNRSLPSLRIRRQKAVVSRWNTSSTNYLMFCRTLHRNTC